MLSILIPVFNFDIRNLVNDLHSQCLASKIDFELICLDDGSKNEFKKINRQVEKLSNVIYEELKVNLGRSKIRNELGKRASFEFLIFMDCDSKVISDHYIFKYLKALNNKDKASSNKESLIYGGRCYDPQPPLNKNHLFHWTYGLEREQTKFDERKNQPYHSFMTNNFLIPKRIFLEIQFDENLTQYGHEDTLFGLELKKRQVPILHIHNPLEHIGLEETIVFLNKSKKAIQNLYYLSQTNDLIETRLLIFYQKLKSFWLVQLTALGFKLIESILIRNFKSKNPNLKLFDVYKLGYLCHITSK
ncbi:MAG: glycosyltransferase [Bacteroidetes bacterium]|jgi:glycosyltransferase involved in cell wall biosynthesis|nr:glycosyltransferase [Bacteroidota bacterium]MDF1864343.1 glycosyltransferase [Saprospiraceae bacterium]